MGGTVALWVDIQLCSEGEAILASLEPRYPYLSLAFLGRW